MTSHPEERGHSGRDVATSPDSGLAKEDLPTHATLLLDESGSIQSWPDTAVSLYGFDPTMILHEPLRVLYVDGQSATHTVDELLDRARVETQQVEHWHKRANGSVFRAMTSLSPVRNSGFQGYAATVHDMTAKQRYEQMLEQQNDRLKKFTDILAHDLRNPLNVISGRVELYQETSDDAHITHIEATADRMERLVEDLLRLARQGSVVKDPEPTALEPVVETAWEGTGQPAAGATLHYDQVPLLHADADRLCELFENLFRNAIDHGGPDVSVRVGPLHDNGFYVDDDGPGLAADSREAVFDHGFTTTEAGSGYGLSVVRTIATAHGWEVRATDAASGGARFEVTGVEFAE